MRLRALERGDSPWRAVVGADGEVEYVIAKVVKGQEFEFHGIKESPPKWCIPLDDEAKQMYEDAYGTSDPAEIPKTKTWKPGHDPLPHPSLRRQPGQVKGAGTGIAGLSGGDTGVPLMPGQ